MGVGQEREKMFDNLAWWLHRHGVRPDHISFLQLPIYAAMIYTGLRATDERTLWTFGILQIVAFIVDGADGILARRTGTVSRRGHLVDEVFDIAGIGITIWVVSIHHGDLASWLFALLIVNFLVYIQNEIQGTKSITYTRGPLTIGFVLDQYYEGLLEVGVALPLVFGVLLFFSRVAWRKRFWTYYQYLTAGQRRTYKATSREERALLSQRPLHTNDPWPKTRTRTNPSPAQKDTNASANHEMETRPPL